MFEFENDKANSESVTEGFNWFESQDEGKCMTFTSSYHLHEELFRIYLELIKVVITRPSPYSV